MNDRILIACVGNIFLGDDAFGVEVALQLTHWLLPENVVVKDFGIRSYDLAYALMDDWKLVILVDALPQGDDPGTVYTFEPDLPQEADVTSALDAHRMDPDSVLRLVSALGGKVRRMLVVGCEPATLEANEDGHIGLSKPVQAAVNEAIRVIHQLITVNSRVRAA